MVMLSTTLIARWQLQQKHMEIADDTFSWIFTKVSLSTVILIAYCQSLQLLGNI